MEIMGPTCDNCRTHRTRYHSVDVVCDVCHNVETIEIPRIFLHSSKVYTALLQCITDDGAACHNAKTPGEYICKLNRRLKAINEIVLNVAKVIGDGSI